MSRLNFQPKGKTFRPLVQKRKKDAAGRDENDIQGNYIYIADDCSGALMLLATLILRERIDTEQKGTNHPAPVGLLCRDVWLYIISNYVFNISDQQIRYVSPPEKYKYQFADSKLGHLGYRALFTMKPALMPDSILNDLFHAIIEPTVGNFRMAEWIVSQNPNYLALKNDQGVTPFQLAIQKNDAEMCAMMKKYFEKSDHLDEMQRQFNELFPKGHAAHLKRLEDEANTLFKNAGIDNNLFLDASSNTKIANFKTALENYVNTHPFHNPFILQKAYEIYKDNFISWADTKLLDFSVHVIGPIQASTKKSSLYWCSIIAQGIFYVAENNEALLRSTLLRGTAEDVRSLENLGATCHIDSKGALNKRMDCVSYYSRCSNLQKICQANTAILENLMRPAKSHNQLPMRNDVM